MTLVQDLMKGFQFAVCGYTGEPLKFSDEKTGDITRMIRIEGFGKTYNFFADSDEQLEQCPPPKSQAG